MNSFSFILYLSALICLCREISSFTVDYYNTTLIREKRQTNTKCPSNNFQCRSGQCIDEDQECDGSVDCNDGSDETTSCHRLSCQAFLFRCNYGACIESEKKCNRVKDCQDGSDESNCNAPAILVRPTTLKCSASEFQCDNGQCIDEDFKCDGQPQCEDQSDETLATCNDFQCPLYTYKCAYGACVNGNSRCNGIAECIDKSDEDPNFCPPIATPAPPVIISTKSPPPHSAVAPPGSCTFPQNPDNGNMVKISSFEQLLLGTYVQNNTFLELKCNRNHKLVGAQYVKCNSGVWSSGTGLCLKLCKPIENRKHLSVSCTFNGHTNIANCDEPVSGTVQHVQCDPFYEDQQLRLRTNRVCEDGRWNIDEPRCVPVCGQKAVQPQTLIIDGTPVKKGEFPWQAAIYSSRKVPMENSCGGSLISPRVVISAAHCVTDARGRLFPKSIFDVAVGKYYRTFNDPRDLDEAQISKIAHMYVPDEYKALTQNYQGDIAILITVKTFLVSMRVQPVCLDRTRSYDPQLSDPTVQGYVTGWGYTTESGKPSDVLKEIKIPAVNNANCLESLPEDFERYLTYDKMCAGFLNKSANVCNGDSGGGLVFRNRQNGRYYLTGIVSISPKSQSAEGGCNSQVYALYTNVSRYIDNFILGRERPYLVT